MTAIIRNLRWNKSAKKMLLSSYRLTWLVSFPPITLFTLFTNYGTSESNLANILFDGAYFLLAVMVVGDKVAGERWLTSWQFWPATGPALHFCGRHELIRPCKASSLSAVSSDTLQAPLQGLCTSSVGEAGLQSRTKLLEKVIPIMSTFLRNKTISKKTPLRKENPFPQFNVASQKCPGIRLSFEYTTTLLSGEGGEGKTGTATMFRKMLSKDTIFWTVLSKIVYKVIHVFLQEYLQG